MRSPRELRRSGLPTSCRRTEELRNGALDQMGGWRAMRGGARRSLLLSDSAAPTATCCEAATTNRRTGGEKIDASRSDKSGRAAGEGQVILGFGKRRWDAFGLNGRIAAFERSCAAFETSAEYLAGW